MGVARPRRARRARAPSARCLDVAPGGRRAPAYAAAAASRSSCSRRSCCASLFRRADDGVGRPADVPAVGAQRGLRRAAGARDVGGDRVPARRHGRHRRRRLPRRAHDAPRPRRRDRPARGRRRCWRWSPSASVSHAAAAAAVRADRLRARRHRPVARPHRAQRDAEGRGRAASTASSIRGSTWARMIGPIVVRPHARPRRSAREMFFVGRACCSSLAIGTVRAACGARRRRRVARARQEELRWISASPAAARSSARRARDWAAAAPRRSRAKACEVTIVARTEATRAPDGRGDRRARRPHGRVGRLRHHDAGGPRRGARRVPRAGHPGQQRRRPAARRFPRLGPRRVDSRARRQHADADRAHQGDGRRHDRAQVRPHRQHHVVRGEGADRHPRPVQRRAQRAHRLRRRRRAQGRARTT